jgi:hypothetical protein
MAELCQHVSCGLKKEKSNVELIEVLSQTSQFGGVPGVGHLAFSCFLVSQSSFKSKLIP